MRGDFVPKISLSMQAFLSRAHPQLKFQGPRYLGILLSYTEYARLTMIVRAFVPLQHL